MKYALMLRNTNVDCDAIEYVLSQRKVAEVSYCQLVLHVGCHLSALPATHHTQITPLVTIVSVLASMASPYNKKPAQMILLS